MLNIIEKQDDGADHHLMRTKENLPGGCRTMKIAQLFHKSFSENSSKRYYYLVYTFSFLVLCFFCFSWFIFSGKALIWFTADGWTQHYKCLVYYAKYLRRIAKTLIVDHRLVIPDWDFCIGEGGDIINAMHYYVIGDPIALLSVFVPTRLMHLFFSLSCILRLYLSGIAFSELCFGTGLYNRKAVLAGALSFSLCFWGLYNAARHPYFLNPLIYFPLLILGIEKIIKNEKPYLFICTAAISAASNFYFFYMIVVLAVGYALIRLTILYRDNPREGFLKLLYMGVMALIGVAIAGMLFVPVMMMFLNDSRMSVSQPFHWFYPLSYYSQLPSTIISNREAYWLCLGFSAPALFSFVLLFTQRKKETLLRALSIVCCIIVIFPIFGRFLNGMSYMTNRWCWAFVLLVIYIMVKKWDDLFCLSKKEQVILTIFSIAYYLAILFLDKSRGSEAFSMIPLFFISLIILQNHSGQWAKYRQPLLLFMIAVSVITISFLKFSPGAANYVSEFQENSKIWNEY